MTLISLEKWKLRADVRIMNQLTHNLLQYKIRHVISITIGLKIKLNSGLNAGMRARNTNTTRYKIEMLIHTL